jgi:enoyl-CoA hydratase
MSGREAYETGLVSHVASADDLDSVVEDLVRRLTAGPPLGYAGTKKAVNAATLTGLEAALARERAGQSLLLRTDDAAEGMRAFSEKRPPVFRSR